MAGDWIKMRTGLRNHPKIVRIMSALCTDRFRIVGALHAVWCVFDEFSIDGTLNGYSLSALDETIGWPGFAQAMYEVEWLQIIGNSLVCPEFSTHNGESAKRRAEDAKRKKSVRKMSAKVTDISRTNCGPEKEKEKDIKEKPPIPPSSKNGHDLLGDKPSPKKNRPKREGLTFTAWIESLPDGTLAIQPTDAVFTYADRAHIPRPFLKLAWLAFEAQMTERKKAQKDWPAHFRNAVKNDWFKLWRFNTAGECYLTTAGKQLEASSAESDA